MFQLGVCASIRSRGLIRRYAQSVLVSLEMLGILNAEYLDVMELLRD